jgi:hypothetical protein
MNRARVGAARRTRRDLRPAAAATRTALSCRWRRDGFNDTARRLRCPTSRPHLTLTLTGIADSTRRRNGRHPPSPDRRDGDVHRRATRRAARDQHRPRAPTLIAATLIAASTLAAHRLSAEHPTAQRRARPARCLTLSAPPVQAPYCRKLAPQTRSAALGAAGHDPAPSHRPQRVVASTRSRASPRE